jgi:hypothetical protein
VSDETPTDEQIRERAILVARQRGCICGSKNVEIIMFSDPEPGEEAVIVANMHHSMFCPVYKAAPYLDKTDAL